VEKQLKHLEMTQAIITRMANNSFVIKGWCVTLVSALIALSLQNSNPKFIGVALIPVLIFWFLDAYFLRQERLFRKLYDHVRGLSEASINFSMNTNDIYPSKKPSKEQKQENSWFKVATSSTIVLFYLPLAGVVVAAVIALKK
jgi:hypothetical protein